MSDQMQPWRMPELWGYVDTGVMYPDEEGFEPLFDDKLFTSYEEVREHCEWLNSHPKCYEGRFEPIRIVTEDPRVSAMEEACEEFRDAVLHQRHQLAENGMQNDQINDVLGLFDDTIGAALPLREVQDG